MTTLPLAGLDILVVEDHYFVATELARVLRQLGASVIGPAARLPLDAGVACSPVHLAVLDVQLCEGTSFVLADEMARRGVPVALITGYESDVLPAPYCSLPRLDKPVDRHQLRALLLQLSGRYDGVAA